MAAPADILSGLLFPAIGGNPGVTSNAGSPVDTSGFGSFTTFGNGSGLDLSSLTGSQTGGFDLSSFGGGGASGLGGSGGGSTPVLDAFGNPTGGSSGSPMSGLTNASFLLPQDQQPGATSSESGAISPGQAGIDQNGPSAMSQLFGAIGNLFQRAGLIVLGVVLIGIGAYFLARPALERAGAKVAKAAATVA